MLDYLTDESIIYPSALGEKTQDALLRGKYS